MTIALKAALGTNVEFGFKKVDSFALVINNTLSIILHSYYTYWEKRIC